jgi:O-antigen ligase
VVLWESYLNVFKENIKVLLLGRGFTSAKVNGRASHNTLMQIIYEFGLIGSVLLIGWACYYVRGVLKHNRTHVRTLDTVILLVGAFLPWMGIDMVFADELFLMPFYAVAGVVYTSRKGAAPK